jgi:hypothetical protein
MRSDNSIASFSRSPGYCRLVPLINKCGVPQVSCRFLFLCLLDHSYVSAEMVKSFIVSAEYRRRFGP